MTDEPLDEVRSDAIPWAVCLRRMSADLGVAWTAIEPFIGVFGTQLEEHCERSVDPHLRSMSVMTCGQGQSYGYRVAQYMEQNGIPERSINRFLSRSKYFDYKRL